MEPEIRLDLRNKPVIREEILHFLYASIQTRLQQRLLDIIDKNCVLQSSIYASFTFKGVDYNPFKQALPRPRNRLHPNLQPAMQLYLDEVKAMNGLERAYISGFLDQVLTIANHPADLLLLLPESIHASVQQYTVGFGKNDSKISPEIVSQLHTKNATAIDLLKQRMVLNLIT